MIADPDGVELPLWIQCSVVLVNAQVDALGNLLLQVVGNAGYTG
jgi:hypothetical protein